MSAPSIPAVPALARVEEALLSALEIVRAAREAGGAPSDALMVAEAARLAGRTPSTVRRWAAVHALGRRVGGQWLLSRERFAAFLAQGSGEA